MVNIVIERVHNWLWESKGNTYNVWVTTAEPYSQQMTTHICGYGSRGVLSVLAFCAVTEDLHTGQEGVVCNHPIRQL